MINTHTHTHRLTQPICKSPSNPYITIGCPRSPKSSRSMIRPGIVQAHNPLAQQARHELVFIFLSVWACPPTWHINLRFLHTLNNCRQRCHAAPSLHYRKPRLLSLPCFSISLKNSSINVCFVPALSGGTHLVLSLGSATRFSSLVDWYSVLA